MSASFTTWVFEIYLVNDSTVADSVIRKETSRISLNAEPRDEPDVPVDNGMLFVAFLLEIKGRPRNDIFVSDFESEVSESG